MLPKTGPRVLGGGSHHLVSLRAYFARTGIRCARLRVVLLLMFVSLLPLSVDSQFMREFKVVVLGSGGVGKSALTVQFVSSTFIEKYDPTIEDFYRKEIEVDGQPSVLEILDTAGTEQFSSMRDLYIKNGQGFVVVYSITSQQTFHDIRNMKEQIVRVKGSENVPILLVGNKCDLSHQRQVRSEEGLALAESWSCPFTECSAKNNQNVNVTFAEIVREMNYVQSRSRQSKTCCSLM